MIDHIYGRINLISDVNDPAFIAELNMYIKYLANEIKQATSQLTKLEIKRLSLFADNLFNGIQYYVDLTKNKFIETDDYKVRMLTELDSARQKLQQLVDSNKTIFKAHLKQR